MLNDFFSLRLLSLCAILRSFDKALLQHLTDVGEEILDALLESSLVTRTMMGTYRLKEAESLQILTKLRETSSELELELHTQAFELFRQRMEQSYQDNQQLSAEEACFYHLEQLFFLLIPRGKSLLIQQYVRRTRQAEPKQKRHQHQLTFYEGLVSVHTASYDQAEAILTILLDESELEAKTRIQTLNALAQVHQSQTRYDQALQWYQKTYQLAHELNNLYYQGISRLNMGMVYNDLRYYEQALNLTEQSLQIFRELDDPLREVYALYEIGNNALQLGRWTIAKESLQEAESLAETQGQTVSLAYICWGQGILYHMLGHLVESEAAYQRALAIAQSPEYNDLKQVSDILWYLGFLYHTEERWEEALQAYQQAATLAKELRRTHYLSLIDYQRGNVFKRQGHLDQAWVAYDAAIEQIESLRAATEGEEIKFGLLDTTEQLYEAMVLLCLEENRAADAFDYVERACSRAFLDKLIEKEPQLYEALEQPVVTLREVQAQLPAGAVLLEYFTVGVVPRGENMINNLPKQNARLREYLTHPPQIFLFAVTRHHLEVHPIKLNPNHLQPKVGAQSPMRRFLRRRQLMSLYKSLIKPVESLLSQHELLYLVPHGPLHYVPWMALQAADGHYLLDQDGPAIALAPSATILLRNCLGKSRLQVGNFLALGYNDQGKQALAYAELEARFLAHLMNGEAWVGSAPKTSRLLAYQPPLRWLHISCHGIFDPHAPLDSELRLGEKDAPSSHIIMRDLQLSADLVTLSACTSGLTHIVPGDELLGLPRAFLYAGAPTVVCTPWEAADLVALLVMEHFYRNLQQGHPPAAALRDAQVAVRTMTGRDLITTLTRWQATYPNEIESLPWPTIEAHQMEEAIFADPTYWALFMLIGRGS
jgi:CHAT domain-containing protein